MDRPTRIAGLEALTVEGQLTQAVQDGVATVFDYDGLARPSVVAAGSHGVSYRSNPGGLPAQITYPSSFEISKEWTALGLVEGVHLGPDTSSPELAGLQYLGAMPAGKWVRPQAIGGTGNIVSAFSKWTYDSDGRLIASITEDPNGSPLMEENLYRDPRGLLTGHALGAAAKGWSHAFDEAGRLTSATQSSFDASGNATSISASGPLPASFDFSYDSAQNLTEMTQVSSCGTETITLTPDASGRHRPGSIGAVTLEWNAAGNLQRKGDLKFTYDVENRLIRVDRQTAPEVFEEVASYTYDALNRRIERRIGERTIHTVWDGWQSIEDYEEAGGTEQLTSRRVYGNGLDEILTFESLVDGEMTAFTPLYDAVGNLRVMVDETGEPVERYMYTPYGKRFVESKGAAPKIHQVRFENGEFTVELSKAVQMSPVETALNGTLTVQNLTRGIAIPLELSLPVEQGPMAGRKWVLSLTPAQPEDLQAGDQLELQIPHTALVDFFDQEASTAISSPSTYSSTGLQVLHDSASPELKHACNSSGTLELTFSETPDLASAASQIQLNGTTTTWSLAVDGYTLVHTGPALSGEQTLSFGTGAFDLSGNALTATESITFQADQSHIWSKPEPSAIGNRYGFKGLPIDEETGLLYVRNRYYDPEMGRFIQPDPYGYTDGPSQYQFALNNPVDFSDPTGESATAVGGIVGGVGGVGYAAYRHLRYGEEFNWNFLIQGALAGAAVGFGVDTLGAGTGLSAAMVGGVAIGAGFGGATGSFSSDGSYSGFGLGATKGGILGLVGGAAGFQMTAAGLSGGWTAAGGIASDVYAGAVVDYVLNDCTNLASCMSTNLMGSVLGFGAGYGVARGLGFVDHARALGATQFDAFRLEATRDWEISIGAKLDSPGDKIGHAFIGLKSPSGEWQAFGLWPVKADGSLGFDNLRQPILGMRGTIADDTDYLGRAATRLARHPISQKQADNVMAFITDFSLSLATKRNGYQLLTSQCATFACAAFERTGIRPPASGYFPRRPSHLSRSIGGRP